MNAVDEIADRTFRFVVRYYTMVIFLFRPSPQVPKPSVRAAMRCYEASAYNIGKQSEQMNTKIVDVTWIFLLSLFMAVNTILWAISYPEVRSCHSKAELEGHLDTALDIIIKSRERWPGTAAASDLYSKLAKACLKSYDVRSEPSLAPSSLPANSPGSLVDASSPISDYSSATNASTTYSQQASDPSVPTFSNVFDSIPDPYSTVSYGLLQPVQTGPPSFRSNSIFASPSTIPLDRRFSCLPPETTQQGLPRTWSPNFTLPPQNPQLAAPILPGMGGPSWFMQQPLENFGANLYADQNFDTEDRQGSLTQEQHDELMLSFESEGMDEIGNLINPSAH